ncbi:hypothetical protein [Candidatus Nitrotoga sp. AM1P]|uniref:hypothetical protein n=1 Tax=Candidatus Nitrotoga sp. AM1P TaxID=2559597 RepID=UPI0010B1F6A4|nr:hypothetical protein [Candidatus Nitrotoga sp. AM1P]BBJ22286.1 hypothetical protein W01_02130 [Candidatus Nitrotoga sp. AM1P]
MLKLSRTILIFLGLSAFDNFLTFTTLAVVTSALATEFLFAILAAAGAGGTASTVGADLGLLLATTLVGNDLVADLDLVTGLALTTFFTLVVMVCSKLNENLKNSYP